MSRGSRGTRYGAAHERVRRAELARWTPGQPCAICHKPTTKKGRLHLAHNEAGTGYLGLAHDTCNTGAAGALTDYHGRRKAGPDPDPRPWEGWS